MMRLPFLHAIRLLAALVACASCGGETGRDAGGPQAATSAGGLVFGRDVLARCGGFGPEQAAGFLGVDAAGVSEASQAISPSLQSCTFSRTDDESRRLTFTISHENTVEDATTSFAQMRDTLPIAAATQKAAGVESDDSALIDIMGLGDEALWTSVNGALTARLGNLTIIVMEPSDRPAQIKVAEAIVAGLR
jgi:hypothetical protein